MIILKRKYHIFVLHNKNGKILLIQLESIEFNISNLMICVSFNYISIILSPYSDNYMSENERSGQNIFIHISFSISITSLPFYLCILLALLFLHLLHIVKSIEEIRGHY